jgi:hypothetical protein
MLGVLCISIKAAKTTKNDFTTATTASNSTAAAATTTAISADSISPPWSFFKYKLEDVRSKLYADSVVDYVTMFRKHGDIHSALYTGSPAMHSHVLGLVLAADARPYGASSSSVGKLQNLRVAVQRRWNNSVSDIARQQSMELFLGLNLNKYFPRVTSVVSPHPKEGVQSDLLGIDSDDTFEAEDDELGLMHIGAELENLHLRKHDGRVGLQEEISNLEPLEGGAPAVLPVAAAAATARAPAPAAPSEPPLIDSSVDSIVADDQINTSFTGMDDDNEFYDENQAMDPLGAVRSPTPIKNEVEDNAGSGGASTQFSSLI